MSSCPVQGQVAPKKQLTEADYEKWGSLKLNKISDSGKWINYQMDYDNGKDTLFLQSTDRRVSLSFPKGRNGRFAGEKLFAFMQGSDLKLIHLGTNRIDSISGIKEYELLMEGKFLLTHLTNSTLQLRDSAGAIIETVENVSEYKINDLSNALVYVRKSNNGSIVNCINLINYSHIQLATLPTVNDISWQQNGKAVAFGNSTNLFCYRFSDKKLYTFDISSISNYSTDTICKTSSSRLSISDDGEKVFFGVVKPVFKPNNDEVEIWNGTDACLFPAQQLLSSYAIPKLVVWFPNSTGYKILSDDSFTYHRLNPTNDYLILCDPYSQGKIPKYPELVDFYIKNVKTGAEKLFLNKHSIDANHLCFSPLNNLILYYKDKNWWLYNPDTDKLKNLTELISTKWDNSDANDPGQFEVYGVAGWTADGKSVLINDANDIWKVSLDGPQSARLTKGKELNITYRMSNAEFENVKIRAYEKATRLLVNLNRDILLTMISSNDWSTGFAIYNSRSGCKTLVYDQKLLGNLRRSKFNYFVYTTETFSQPPRIEFIKSQRSVPLTLYSSNRQAASYSYGHSQLIHYKNSTDQNLKGALFYPADYDPLKKYPLIVSIYEEESVKLHRYENPTLLNQIGNNVTKFTLEGYFVLLPDIVYTLSKPGESALDCVTSAVRKVLESKNIDSSKVGLMGHSFGSFETNFIITKSNMFAAAISGSGFSDLIGRYFEIGVNGISKSEMWRFESQQLRMGASAFEKKESYLRNSPILSADTIKTPLLLWSGKDDRVVPVKQSISFYMALRRLGKQTILLAYPNEGHTFVTATNQIDLTRRIINWFDYFLKGKKDIGWITVGVQPE